MIPQICHGIVGDNEASRDLLDSVPLTVLMPNNDGLWGIVVVATLIGMKCFCHFGGIAKSMDLCARLGCAMDWADQPNGLAFQY